MHPPSRRPAPLLALALAAALFGAPAPRRASSAEPVAVEGKRVRVFSTVPWDPLAKRALEAAEATLALCEESLPYRLPEGERLVFHVYGIPPEYREALKAEPGAAQNLTATLLSTRESYLLAQPRPDAKFLALVGDLPEALRFALAREAVRQFLLKAGGPGYLFWPDWYAEGIADHIAGLCVTNALGKDAPPAILLDDRRHLAKDGLERGRWIRLDRAVHAWQPEAADPDLRSLYAEWDELYRMLALDPARLAALHARVRDLKPPPDPGKGEPDRRIVLAERAIAESLAAVYGPLDALDARLRAEVAAAKPQWFEPLRSVQRAGDEIVAAGRPGLAAIAIRAEPAPKEPFVISCEMQIVGLGEKEAQIYLAFENRSDPMLLKVILKSGDAQSDGKVALVAFAYGSLEQRYLVESPPMKDLGSALAPLAWIPVRVEADASRILVDVRGRRVLEADVPPGFDVLGNQVGVGSFFEVVRFRNFTVAPAKR